MRDADCCFTSAFLWTAVQKSRGIWVALGRLEIKEAIHIYWIQLWDLMRIHTAWHRYRGREVIWSFLTLYFWREFKGNSFFRKRCQTSLETQSHAQSWGQKISWFSNTEIHFHLVFVFLVCLWKSGNSRPLNADDELCIESNNLHSQPSAHHKSTMECYGKFMRELSIKY